MTKEKLAVQITKALSAWIADNTRIRNSSTTKDDCPKGLFFKSDGTKPKTTVDSDKPKEYHLYIYVVRGSLYDPKKGITIKQGIGLVVTSTDLGNPEDKPDILSKGEATITATKTTTTIVQTGCCVNLLQKIWGETIGKIFK